ncbi:hypothetical protein HPB50_012010 [Hyalomma asiaticum]|uniref:Uncharacterized protein n=1 Tax=Hyalomma asiaticum TaxID=266040 RepID=A0ACB7RMC8_HYAAI|nr:hypothetical protein HPB50_012010 [Hyalomma asiaticum]
MGRPRVVRTPSEEREFQLRRKEARRARLRNRTEEQLAIARARNAAAQRRRRESNAEVRQRELEARRQRRQDPEVRRLEAAKHRARREDAAVRLREAEARRRRRLNSEIQKRENESEADWQLRLRQRKELSKGLYPCDICLSLTLEGGLSAVPTADVPLLAAEFPDEDVDRFALCSSCSAVFTTVATRALARSDSDSHPASPTRLCEYSMYSEAVQHDVKTVAPPQKTPARRCVATTEPKLRPTWPSRAYAESSSSTAAAAATPRPSTVTFRASATPKLPRQLV